MSCHESNMLTPKYRFDVNLKDNTGSIIGTISGEKGEKLLSLTAEQIYDLASTEIESQSMQHAEMSCNQNLFKIQVKKPASRTDQTMSGKVQILAYTEKGNIMPSLPAQSTLHIKEGSKKQKMDSTSVEQAKQQSEQHKMLKLKQKIEPSTPMKKK
ncbi:hypothetical protein P3L10_005752 [Capsicum annuum]